MKQIILILIVALTMFSCDSDDYLVDGGISDPNVGTSTFEFLKSHNQLDTLAILIERAGLKNVVDGETTLFAPNNLSIKKYVNAILTEMRESDPEAEFTIDDIPTDELSNYLGAYIFDEKIVRDDMLKEGKIYVAHNGEERLISLEPTNNYANQLDEFPEYVYYTYKDGDEWDEWDNIVDDTKVLVRTSNLISTNGVIHVLQGNHILFNYDTN